MNGFDFLFLILGIVFALLIASLILIGLYGKLGVTVENTLTGEKKSWGNIED